MKHNKRKLTPAYLFFYLLFWPDTWRIAFGVVAAGLLTPRILPADRVLFEAAMVFVMLACIGYAVSAKPARRFTLWLQKAVLKNRRS